MPESHKGKIENAEAAALAWMSLVDDGKYSESWEGAAGLLQKAVSQDQFAHSLDAARGPMGALVSREVIKSSYETELPGAPDGEYVVIQYASSFVNKKKAVETVTPMLADDGIWKVSGYYIK